jgi:hypothetical protein
MIYLREGGGQYVGPFKSRKEAERFIKLMELCGENWADTEVVEEDGVDSIAGQERTYPLMGPPPPRKGL